MRKRSRCVLMTNASVLVLVPWCSRGGVAQLYQTSPDSSVLDHLALLKSCGCVPKYPASDSVSGDGHVESMAPESRVRA